jgi:alanine racemase
MYSKIVHSPAKALIDCEALRYNLSQVKLRVPQSKVISVIKANAYGHGMVQAANALDASDAFAVARIDEAMELRTHGVSKQIILLEGVLSQNETKEHYRLCVEYHFIPAIHSIEQINELNQFAINCPDIVNKLRYWLKLDTGMHRLGFVQQEVKTALKKLGVIKGLGKPWGVMSHFACADEKNNPLNQQQLNDFESTIRQYALASAQKSMANSAAILSISDAAYDWVRPGIMLYGVSPFTTGIGLSEGLKPVMTLSSKIIAIKQLGKGDTIGYGSSWCCPEDMSIAVVAIGYGDGYPRYAQSGTPVLVNGIQVPLVGRVSMDMITVELRAFRRSSKSVKVGDDVTLWGRGLPIEWVARKASTIGYELLCQVTRRVEFEYISH